MTTYKACTFQRPTAGTCGRKTKRPHTVTVDGAEYVVCDSCFDFYLRIPLGGPR